MKVHLLRSKELCIERFENVLNILQQFRGPITFTSEIENENLRSVNSAINQIPSKSKKKLNIVESQSWNYFFLQCKNFRKKNNISELDHVFLLTDIGNDLNWFAGMDSLKKDYFIHTAGWSLFFGKDVDDRFPIAYEVAIWLIRHLMFDDHNKILKVVHMETRGCGNDLCMNKKDIILKMRTADICSDCMNVLQKRKISPLVLNQLFSIIDGIRTSMMFRKRVGIFKKPSRIEIVGRQKKIYLTDLGNLELRFNPKEKSIFLFFLNHPEGVHLSHLQDFRREIKEYYQLFSNQDEQIEIEKSLNRLLDPIDNDINVVLSRIKRKLKDLVGAELMNHYIIDGPHGGKKRIILDREFVFGNTNP